jgi:hypothetical protein
MNDTKDKNITPEDIFELQFLISRSATLLHKVGLNDHYFTLRHMQNDLPYVVIKNEDYVVMGLTNYEVQ